MFSSFVKADLPTDYIANYEISENREKILETFVKIDAMTKVGSNIPAVTFKELNANFKAVFIHFPKDYEFKVVYEQCLITTQSLGNGYNYAKLNVFLENCYTPFQWIIKQINTKYTIIASAWVSPSNGPAPLIVTFDARNSLDPSNETIPENNFFWYYRDVDGVDKIIWNKNVLSYEFEKAGNYVVHLTVRSSNKSAKWIFDGEETMSVNVSPKSAIITMYANGKKLDPDKIFKIWVQEAEMWIVFDASATIPVGGRKILWYSLDVTSNLWFSYNVAGDGEPGIFNIPFADKWEYLVELTTIDNETNKISEKYSLVVSDPVSIIKQSPEEWTTSTTFSFDATTSYSVVSRIRLYTWEIFAQNWDKIKTVQWKKIKQELKEPGSYTVKLTVEDAEWKTDISTTQVFVESTDPIAQFTTKPKTETKFPSEFVLDAWWTSDIDEINGFDKLTYDWKFSTDQINISPIDDTNESVLISFDEVGAHTITLIVSDSFGKITEVSKDIDVKSVLRPKLFVSPKATNRGKPITFALKSNKEILSYVWDFGDGETRTVQTNKISHIYKKVWEYKVKVSVSTSNWDSNEVETSVFVGEKNGPIASYKILNASQVTMTQNDICPEIINWLSVDRPSYRVQRYEKFKIDTSDSVNAKWTSSDLSMYFQPKNDEIYKSTSFSHAFDELGCHFVDITVEDTVLWKNNKIRVWFNVINALPTLENVILFFPQYGNEMGIGFQENNVKDIFNNQFDPLMVKVVAQSPEDADGFVSYFKWYYYYKEDPSRFLETKITPSDIPYAFFSLPRVPGEFMFGVAMYDSDDWRQTSEEIIWNGPVVFFPPDAQRPDIPLVTLKANKLSADVWDEVIFNVVSKIISDKSDFVKERTIMYDFDGDWERDLTTKKDRVTYVYETANEDGYTPRAAVLYRWYKWIWKWGSIVVKKWLKPRLLFDFFDKYVIFREMSLGEIEKKEICLSLRLCKANEEYIVDDGIAFDFEFPEYKKYVTSISISDKHANEASKRWVLDLTWMSYSWDFHIMSIPESNVSTGTSGNIEFFVGKSLDNSILFNVLFDDQDEKLDCFVDVDITVDSDDDWVKDLDRNFSCNELHLQSYEPKYDSSVWRIYYQSWDRMYSKDFIVNFLDFQIHLDPEMKELYDKIYDLIITIDTSYDVNEYLKSLLISLKKWLLDDIDTKSTVVAIQNYLVTHDVVLKDSQRDDLDIILIQLSDESVIAAQWWNEYDQAKTEVVGILESNLKKDVNQLFREFENTIWSDLDEDNILSQQEHRKKLLQDIVNLIASKMAAPDADVWEAQVDPMDMEMVIMPNMCKIMEFYEIPSESCVSDTLQVVPEDALVLEESVNKTSWVKILFIVMWIWIWIFVALVVVFAVKAKLSAKDVVEEPDDVVE